MAEPSSNDDRIQPRGRWLHGFCVGLLSVSGVLMLVHASLLQIYIHSDHGQELAMLEQARLEDANKSPSAVSHREVALLIMQSRVLLPLKFIYMGLIAITMLLWAFQGWRAIGRRRALRSPVHTD